MTSTALLEIANSFTTAADDQTDSAIGHHDLNAVLSFTKGRLVVLWLLVLLLLWLASATAATTTAATSAAAIAVCGTHLLGWIASVLLDDPVDLTLGINSSARIARNTALTYWSGIIGASDELDPGARVLLDAAQILALTSNDQSY